MDNRPPRTPLPPPPQRPSLPSTPAASARSGTQPVTQMSAQPHGYGPPSGYGPPPTAYAPPVQPQGYGPPPSMGAYGAPMQPPVPPMPQNAYASHAQPAPSYGPVNTSQTSYGSLPPLGWQGSMPPGAAAGNASSQRTQKTALIAGGAAAAALGVLALIGGAVALFHTNHKPLPVEAAQLPATTDFFQEDRFPGADGPENAREAFLTSDLARHVCGAGSDFADRLMALKTTKVQTDALALFEPKTLEARRATLECGQSFVKALESPTFTEVVFHDGDEKDFHAVEMIRLRGIDELPAKYGFARQTFSGFPGQCLVSPKKTESWQSSGGLGAFAAAETAKAKEKDGECTDQSLAAFHDGKTWFFGRRTSIEAFARAYSKPKKDLSTTVENLQLAFDSGEGLAMRRADARPKAASQLLKLPCSLAAFDSGAGSKFVEECLPKSVEKNASAIDAKVRAVTYEFDAPIHEGDGINFNMFFVGRDTDAAKDIENELKDVARDWKSSIDNNESRMTKLVHDAPSSLGQRKWSVAIDPFVRALRGGAVSRSGRVVALRLSEKFSSGEMKEMNEVMAKTQEDAAAVATITQALVKGQPVPEATLATLVGADMASFVLSPRATDKECAPIREKLGRFEMTNPAAIPASMRFNLRLRCEGSPMPRATIKCLTDATDAVTFGKCPMPVDPTIKAAAGAGALDLENVRPSKTVLQ